MEKECENGKPLVFLENKSYSQIYTFTLQVICTAQENSELIYNFELQKEEHLQRNWLKYWIRQGHKIVLDLWKFKYKEYLAHTIIDNSVIDDQNKVHEKEFKESEDVEESYKTWEELFQEHSQEIYWLQYNEFENIFYQRYYIDLINSLQTNIETSATEKEIEENFETNTTDLLSVQDRITEELEQLKLLGLPTRFGPQPHALVGNNEKKKKRVRLFSDSSTDTVAIRDEAEDDEDILLGNFEDPTKQLTMADDNSEQQLHSLQNLTIKKSEKVKKNRKLKKIPAYILEDRVLLKYWRKRFSLFSRFDEGIRLDRESWFSVTPEKVAKHLAERLACDTLVDGFCGSGGNAIQFAKTCRRVIAIDIDPQKIEMAKHNATIYNVAERIEFIVGDFFHFAERLKADIVFLSPPWGGPKYKNKEAYDIEKCLLPMGASKLVTYTRHISENIALFLPRNSNIQQIIKIAGVGNRCEIEHNYLDTRLVGISALYGDCILERQSESNNE